MMKGREFSQCYEETRQRFNRFAEELGIRDKINALLVEEIEQSKFNHKPHLAHLFTDLVASLPKTKDLNMDGVHRAIDYYFDYSEHSDNENIRRMRRELSSDYLQAIELLGPANNYTQALAQSKLLYRLNPHVLDPQHIERFRNLRGDTELKMQQFAQDETNQQLESIQLENQALLQKQDSALASLEELSRVQSALKGNLQDIGDSMATSSDVSDLVALLKSQGIEVSEALTGLLAKDELTRKKLNQVLTYLAANEKEKMIRCQQEMKAANYQGLSDACYFVAQVGELTGSRALATTARVAQAGVKISQAVERIASGALSGAALLGPISAIGMATLGILSLFRHSPDPHQQIMKQIEALSAQIKALHHDVLDRFDHVDQRLTFLLEIMLQSFHSAQLSQHVSVTRNLFIIQGELKTLMRYTKAGFEEMLLKDLGETVAYVDDLRDGKSSSQHLTQADYESKLRLLRSYVLERSCSPLLNGAVYAHLLEENHASTSQLVSLLQEEHVLVTQNILGLVNAFLGKRGVEELQDIKQHHLFHPEIWRIGLSTYIALFKMMADQYYYDAKGANLIRFKEQAERMMRFFNQLQEDESLYLKVFEQIETDSQCVGQALNQLLEKLDEKQNFSSVLKPVDVPEKLKSHTESVRATQQFFTQDKLLSALAKREVVPPKEFIVAQELGIGQLEYTVYLPSSLYKKHHKHHGKYKVKKGEKAGVEIHFNIRGSKTLLYSPGLTIECRYTKLSGMYEYFMSLTKPVADLKKKTELISQKTKQFEKDQNKQRALRVASSLSDSPEYNRLLQYSHFLVQCAVIAGFPKELVSKIKNILFLKDVIPQYEAFSRNVSDQAELPTCRFVDGQQLGALRDEMVHFVREAKDPEIVERECCSTLVAQVQAGIAEINEALIFNNLLHPTKAANSDSPRNPARIHAHSTEEVVSKPLGVEPIISLTYEGP